MKSEILAFQDVHFRITKPSNAPILKGVSLSLCAGESVALLGRNGSGKSTLLSLLYGNRRWQTGSFKFNGTLSTPQSIEFKKNLGVVFQNPGLDLKLSASENLYLQGLLHGFSASGAKKRAIECLHLVSLADKSNEKVGVLSGGMKRRVDLARALMSRPRILLLDEPSAGLDLPSFRQLWVTLNELMKNESLSVLVATHRADEADQCARVVFLEDGIFKACDTPQNLRNQMKADILILESENPEQVGKVLKEIFNLEFLIDANTVTVSAENAAQLIPKIVESLPSGMLSSVNLRQINMGDVFMQLTGQSLKYDTTGTRNELK